MPNRPGSEEIASSMPLPLFMRGIIHDFGLCDYRIDEDASFVFW
jgi:hypothetical protein